ncbi:unnamed protein product [Linum trigynum]|uniref:Uncharacterized protein n=1 Tax=Linum trigynum TaxID=586398 RepID=A0AAV2DQM8_9ROSI
MKIEPRRKEKFESAFARRRHRRRSSLVVAANLYFRSLRSRNLLPTSPIFVAARFTMGTDMLRGLRLVAAAGEKNPQRQRRG